MTILIPVLGDQLSLSLASLRDENRGQSVVLFMEVHEEATHVRHHKKKIALVFSAMRHFADELRAQGWNVDYVTLDDPQNTQNLTSEVCRAVTRHRATSLLTVAGSEYRILRAQKQWSKCSGIPCEIREDDRFLCTPAEFAHWTNGRKNLRMEHFYREMRHRTGLLMTPNGEPVGGEWNFDHDNRKTPPPDQTYPDLLCFTPDSVTQDVLALVSRRFGDHFGDLEPFALPVTRKQALEALSHFINKGLPDFGRYQDAMVTGQDYLFHSSLSFCINLGLLAPLEVCQAAAQAYDRDNAPLNSVEGFIRQIIGWREYMRGMYWHDMPQFASRNALEARRPLPEFFWTGKTDMNCLAQSIDQTRRKAYAHHIQRLMVLGNFALLAGIEPERISEWFLVVYVDAFEWVEMPNVLGMSQYADGGKIASKPYVASGAYINRMSDYCKPCRYDVKRKTGPDACPFNALYWDFLARHEARLSKNIRMKNVYATWNRLSNEKRREYRQSATDFLDKLAPIANDWAHTQ